MKIDYTHKSPNFSQVEIPVDFLVLHYTACDLERTLNIFKSDEKKVAAHFVIDTDGTVYDLGGFYNGPILLAGHAGKSHLTVNKIEYVNFNQFSIGIEIINFNGNLNKYTDAQYESLSKLVGHLQTRFKNLKDSNYIVGHEHIAHWRGKADPGVLFDWTRFLTSVGLRPTPLHSFFACGGDDLEWLSNSANNVEWSKLNYELETRIALRKSQEKNSNS